MDSSAQLSLKVVRHRLLGREPKDADGPTLHLDHRELIATREWQDGLRRLRCAFGIGAVVWPSVGLLDAFVANGDVALLYWLLGARAVGWPLIILGWLIVPKLRDRPRIAVHLLDAFVFTAACVLVSVMCLRFGGIESGYSTGLLLVIMVRAATIAEPWRHSIVIYGLMCSTFPAFMLTAAQLDPQIASQFATAHGRTFFGMQNVFVLIGAASCVACGDAVWRARREAYETRDLGRYRLKHRIGRGAMGEIWLAHHAGLRIDVALKVLVCRRLDEKQSVGRFEREVVVIASLSHPNTIRILDYGVTPEGILFYAMELLRGCDLQALLRREGALEPTRAVRIMMQACEALAEAHESNVIHRDIKPSNIFVTSTGGQADFVKVLDFGLAKFTREESMDLTSHGSLLGTPRYMAPEALAGDEVDARSDVYSVGCVLYELLTGRPPFEAIDLHGVLRQQASASPVLPPRQGGGPLNEGLQALTLRCLERSPERRFRDARQIVEALRCLDA
jgi:tRNA A-37 threonylcarbamoyl transferase component Bud32